MPLVNVPLPIRSTAIPGDVRAFLSEARQRIDDFQKESRILAFVPSDFELVYAALAALADVTPVNGSLFCEWGSGFGVVACLAAMLDFDACGIEIEGELVAAARSLADDFGLPVEFVHGSFLPSGFDPHATGEEYAWLTTSNESPGEEMDLAPEDFDVIFAYPWPDEEYVTENVFQRFARTGALLVTYHGSDDFRLRRKGRSRQRRM
jgi:hypothetical protein